MLAVVLVDQDKVIQRHLADLAAEEMVETILKLTVDMELLTQEVEAEGQMVMVALVLLLLNYLLLITQELQQVLQQLQHLAQTQ